MRWRTVDPQEYARMLAPHLGQAAAAGIAGAYVTPTPPPGPALVVRGSTTVQAWAAAQNWAG